MLDPNQTVLIDPGQDLCDNPRLSSGGVSIEHSGRPGSLIAKAMIQNATIGFSSAVLLTDPAMPKSSSLQGPASDWVK